MDILVLHTFNIAIVSFEEDTPSSICNPMRSLTTLL
jgi:hypothetical protein